MDDNVAQYLKIAIENLRRAYEAQGRFIQALRSDMNHKDSSMRSSIEGSKADIIRMQAELAALDETAKRARLLDIESKHKEVADTERGLKDVHNNLQQTIRDADQQQRDIQEAIRELERFLV